MCEACGRTHDPRELLARCETALEGAPYTYWRALSEIERKYGDVDRVREDMERAELSIAEVAGPVVRKMAQQLADEAREVVKSGDMQALNTLAASYTAQLANVMRKEMAKSVDAGRKQVLDQFTAQKGTQLAGMRQDPRKATQYLAGRANVAAGKVGTAIASAITDAAATAIGTGNTAALVGAESTALTNAILSGTRTLVGVARALGRESVGVGRLLGFDEVKDDVLSVHYTAVLDNNVCDECMAMDGDEYGAEEFGKAPNPDCVGAQYGNECRCFEVLIFARD